MKKKVKLENVKFSKGKTDWNHVKNSKDEVIDNNAPALTQAELNQLKKAKTLNK